MKYEFKNLFIFEMANNHQGSVDHGIEIIKAMAEIAHKHDLRAGVKLQYRQLESMIHPDFKVLPANKHIPRFLGTRLSPEQFKVLLDTIRYSGLIPIVTPFDEPSVDLCVRHGVEIIKIGSSSAMDWPLLEKVSATEKPVIISTGGLSLYEMDQIVSFFTHKDVSFALMHCVSIYPTPANELRLSLIEKMARRYPEIPVGYSGHEAPENLDAVKVAVSKGAQILERHVGIAKGGICLNAYSMSPEQAERWAVAAQQAKAMLGEEESPRNQAEGESLTSLKRGVFATRPIRQGEVISRDDVFFAMPCQPGQTDSGEFGKYQSTFIASRDYAVRHAIFETNRSDAQSILLGVIHDVKSILYEANIELGSDMKMELSHHCGLENIRKTGAVIVNVINRSYCKKLIVMLPGQKHPSHRHRKKEETFHLLWGRLEVLCGGKRTTLKPGDQLLIEHKAWHTFWTTQGAVVEEISTTHYQDDSEYADEEIKRLSLAERKTTLALQDLYLRPSQFDAAQV